ncbi:MAG: hypothetical protein APR53_10345, partial [Methanoculleus sp. SDB]
MNILRKKFMVFQIPKIGLLASFVLISILLIIPVSAEAGEFVGWGDNTYGALNILLGGDFKQVSAGRYHNAALKEDGSLVAWG